MVPAHGKYTMIPIKRTDVFQTVVQQLTNFLNAGDLQPGDRLPSERELAEHLNVSRTSVRQALKVLESAGRIETRVGSGTYVLDASKPVAEDLSALDGEEVTQEFMTQLIEARTALERVIFERFIEVANRKNIAELKKMVEDNAEEFLNPADESMAGLDMTFESKICEITGNPILMNLLKQVQRLWVSSWRRYGFVPERLEKLHHEHLEIIDSLVKGDFDNALELMTAHVDKAVR